MRNLIRSLFYAAVAMVALCQTTDAQDTTIASALPQPVFVAPVIPTQDSQDAIDVNAGGDSSPELPASMRNPGEILTLATAGPAALPPLQMQSMGCNPKPLVRCLGPDFCGCSPRIYYGTNPCDDDPVLTMSPTINDPLTRHWYQKAWDMVVRKKNIAAAINN